MRATWALVLALAPALASCGGKEAKKDDEPAKKSNEFTLFVTTEMRGQIEPCGCTTDPLGDLARTTELVSAAREGTRPALFVDGGSMLYSAVDVEPHLVAQEKLKSDLLANVYETRLNAAAIALGPNDLAMGADAVRPPRQAANVPADSGIATEPPKVVDAGDVKVGLFGVVAPSALAVTGVEASDPIEAARAAVAALDEKGAQVVVGLAHMTRREAANLAEEVDGIDFLVVGQNAPEPDDVSPIADPIGSTFLVQPANRGQVITRIDVTVGEGDGMSDAIGEAAAKARVAALDERIAKLDEDLAEWKADPEADPAFLERKQAELAALRGERDELAADPLRPPETGSWFVLEQIEIDKALPCNEAVQAAKTAYDRAAGKANVAAAEGTKPPEPAEGKPGYAGIEECDMCHDEAVAFWKKTKHAQAWETLDDLGKQFDFACIYCHVTGFDEPGGSNLAVNEHLRDVQCEVCHGPGSLHVDSEDPDDILLSPESSRCETCHNSDHSDTFQYEAYLRDVTGTGHGANFRAKLGSGPTGRELRAAGLAEAGKEIGARCLK